MEITLEGIIALITLFVGGSGIGGLLTWRWLKKKAKAEAKKAEKGETDEKPKSTMIHKADIQVNVPKKIIKVKPGPPIDKPAKVERRGRPPKQAPKNDDHEELEKRLREKGVLK